MVFIDTPAVVAGMATVSCCDCGIRFDVPDDWKRARRNDHRTFYCPNGHAQFFSGKSEAEKLRDELAREMHRAEQAEASARDLREQRDHTARRLVAHKGVVTKLKKRAADGRCPCCSHLFKDLRSHMRTQHPDFDPSRAAEAIAEKATEA